MTERHFVDLTIRSYDELNGTTVRIHPDDIRQLVPGIKFWKEKIPSIGEKPDLVTMVYFANGRHQTVRESVDNIEDQIKTIKETGKQRLLLETREMLPEGWSLPKKKKASS
jgi:uncharacterized protein YlzI (FlbEa/FlbD family)